MQKRDFIWLSHNTVIDNYCTDLTECEEQNLKLKVFRRNHLDKLHNIFADNITDTLLNSDGSFTVEIHNLSICDFCETALNNNSNLYFNIPDGKIYYVPVDLNKYQHIFRRCSSKTLAALPNRKKLDILMAINQESYISISVQDKHQANLNKHYDKLQALLQLQVPPQFLDSERRKLRLITTEIANLPHIKEILNSFHRLPIKQQKKLLNNVCAITAKYNNIRKPHLHFLTQKQIDNDAGLASWVTTEAYTYENNVCINMSKLNELSAIQALSLAWHETTHVAQAYADYPQFPQAEDLFNRRLDFLQQLPETYIFHPQELITYALERQFIEECNAKIKARPDERNYMYQNEYDVATQYLHRAITEKQK